MGQFDDDAAKRAKKQNELLTYRDVRALRGNAGKVAVRVRRRQIQKPHRGVYLFRTGSPTWLQRVQAGFRYLGPDATASHETGAVLYGLDVEEPEVIAFTMTQEHTPAPSGIHVYRSRRPLTRKRWRHDVRVASVERILLDLASVLDREALERAVESALREELTTVERIYMTLIREGGRGVTGTRLLWLVMEERPAGRPARSVFEIRTGHALRAGGLGHFVRNYPVIVDGEPFEIDKAYVDAKVAVESDGAKYHSTRAQRERDKRRQRKLEAAGWRFRRVTYEETLTAAGRARLVADVAALLTTTEWRE